MERITITEIARRCGVSKSAVSYALNGRPGVSPETREHILVVARELGWAPNRTARLLSGSRTDTVGLVLARDARTLGSEPFYMEFIAGMESALSPRSYALLLQVCDDLDDEVAVYRRWVSERRVDAVVIVDVRVGDPRLALVAQLGLPAVFVCDPSMAEGFTTVWTDDGQAMRQAVERLAGLGHRRLARVAGMSDLSHVRIRDAAFRAALGPAGCVGEIVHADFSAGAAREVTARLFETADRPTAIVFDNDLMAAAALGVLADLDVDVPGEVSVLAWDDSPLCQITHPQLSAMSHDVMSYGTHVTQRLFDLLEGAPAAAHLDSVPTFTARASTGPPPGG